MAKISTKTWRKGLDILHKTIDFTDVYILKASLSSKMSTTSKASKFKNKKIPTVSFIEMTVPSKLIEKQVF
ncbi:MAG: hypothetical protein SFU99_16635 [Saprospiraceae bacterium]|nr:hypothetical protein [Saprospiraceae bacterium]